MARRRKSFSDILEQMERIESNPLLTQKRYNRAIIATDRYTDNIMRSERFKKGGRDAYDIKFSRRAYMGLSNG